MGVKVKKKTQPVKPRTLTVKQQKFVDCYDGNAAEAAKEAGYNSDYGRVLMAKPHVFAAVHNRQDTEVRPVTIANRQERQEYWSKQMRGKGEFATAALSDRNMASKLLGKSEADFTDKHIIDDKRSLEAILGEAGQE